MMDNQRMLIQYVINNDLRAARQYAAVLLRTNKTAKDQQFCEQMLVRMAEQEKKGMEVPQNLKGILQLSCTAYEFEPTRVFVSGREKNCMKHIKKMYAASGKMAQMGIHYANAVLLHGVSGTGKTTFAQLVAKDLELPFFYVSMTQMINSYLGKTAQNMELVFNFISSLPCVCVIDEIDSIGSRRTDDSGVSGELKRVLLCIMQNLDKLPNNVIIIAATNQPEAIDEALMRRFPVKHGVLPLGDSEAEAMVTKYMSAIGLRAIGSIQTFLKTCVSERQNGLPFEKRFTPATIIDCLNERIAEAFAEGKPDSLAVSLYDGALADQRDMHPFTGLVNNSAQPINSLLAGRPIGIPDEYKVDKQGCRKISPIERQLDVYDMVDLECPRCGKKTLRVATLDSITVDFPQYQVHCDNCNWWSPTGKMSDYGEVFGVFKTWYAAWTYLGKPKERVDENLIKEFGYTDED